MESHDFRRVVTFEGSMLLGYASGRKIETFRGQNRVNTTPKDWE